MNFHQAILIGLTFLISSGLYIPVIIGIGGIIVHSILFYLIIKLKKLNWVSYFSFKKWVIVSLLSSLIPVFLVLVFVLHFRIEGEVNTIWEVISVGYLLFITNVGSFLLYPLLQWGFIGNAIVSVLLLTISIFPFYLIHLLLVLWISKSKIVSWVSFLLLQIISGGLIILFFYFVSNRTSSWVHKELTWTRDSFHYFNGHVISVCTHRPSECPNDISEIAAFDKIQFKTLSEKAFPYYWYDSMTGSYVWSVRTSYREVLVGTNETPLLNLYIRDAIEQSYWSGTDKN